MSPVLGNVTRLKSKHMYYAIESRLTWDEVMNVNDPDLLCELTFWVENVFRLNCRKIFTSEIPEIISFSDASDTGCGSTLSVGNQICHMTWNTLEKTKSSTWRELTAIKFGILSFLSLISNKSLYWFSDNQAALHIVTNGSRKKHLQYLAVRIFKLCLLNGISIILRWIPRCQNELADFIRLLIMMTGTSLLNFSNISINYRGPHTIDRFADFRNRKISRYNSRFWNPGCEAVDAFSQNWSGENNWLVPPVYLIASTVRHLLASKAPGTLIAPAWPSAPFWPLLYKSPTEFQPYVSEIRIFRDATKLLKLGNYIKEFFAGIRKIFVFFTCHKIGSKRLETWVTVK